MKVNVKENFEVNLKIKIHTNIHMLFLTQSLFDIFILDSYLINTKNELNSLD